MLLLAISISIIWVWLGILSWGVDWWIQGQKFPKLFDLLMLAFSMLFGPFAAVICVASYIPYFLGTKSERCSYEADWPL